MTVRLAAGEANRVLVRAWEALGPYQNQAILVGGMAVFLYEAHPRFQPISGIPALPTVDIDVAVRNPLRLSGNDHLAHHLVEAGFSRRDIVKDATSYTRFDFPAADDVAGDARAEPYLEFLCPTDDVGVRDDEPQTGLRAHLSPYAWMLYCDPWAIAHPSGLQFLVPHPLTYFAQKLLIRATRPQMKRTKDLIDALYVLGGFRGILPDIFSARWRISQQHPEGREQIANACETFEWLFTGRNSTGPVQVASGYSQDVTTPEMRQLAQIAGLVARDIIDAESASRTPPP